MVVFAPLSSGSQGNSILVRGPQGAFLIDAGLPRREMLTRLAAAGHRPEDIDGIVLSHRHLDHVRGAGPLSRRFKIPVYATDETLRHQRPRMLHRFSVVHPGLPFQLAGYRIHPVQVCHDAPTTLAFLIEAGETRFAIATDLGSPGGALLQVLTRIDVLYLEFNHDLEMLRSGPYPWPLKHRIASATGHLSNAQAATLLSRLATPRLRRLYLAHLSETNNTPSLAEEAAREALEGRAMEDVDIRIAQQHRVSEPHD